MTARPVLLYDTLTGKLSFDPDGTGKMPATEFVTLVDAPVPDLQGKDVTVY